VSTFLLNTLKMTSDKIEWEEAAKKPFKSMSSMSLLNVSVFANKGEEGRPSASMLTVRMLMRSLRLFLIKPKIS